MNPLHAGGWFALGYCALKTGDFGRALQAFSRSAQQEPENGDAWNNLAAIHLQVPLFRLFMSALKYPILGHHVFLVLLYSSCLRSSQGSKDMSS